MNEDGTPIEGEQSASTENTGVAREGAVQEASADDIQSMYDDLGVKAPVPTDAAKRRSKPSTVRAKDVPTDDDADSDEGRKGGSGKSKPKDSPNSDEDGDAGSDNRPKKSEKRDEDGQVHDESEEAGKGVRKAEPKSDEDSERGSEEKPVGSDNGDGQGDDESEESQEDSEDEGKRPGKSDPKVERRFQKLANDAREKEQQIEQQSAHIQNLEKQLLENTQTQQQAQSDREDPEYTIEDFRGDVQDNEGNVVRLSEEQSELAFRRWQDGYSQRKAERDAKSNFETTLRNSQEEHQRKTMQSSVEAYDTLTSTLESYPALQNDSPEFDKELSDAVMPLIQDMVLYQEGTEPGNANNVKPVIVGLSMQPKKLLDVIAKLRNAKRSLPLNGTHDNVESRSNVSVPHGGRSSDPDAKAANELMQELGIKKRF